MAVWPLKVIPSSFVPCGNAVVVAPLSQLPRSVSRPLTSPAARLVFSALSALCSGA